jgi:hypothetical protein
MKHLKTIIAVINICVTFIFLGSLVYFDLDYAYTKPRVKQPEFGRIYNHNVHGTIVYLTKQEDSLLQWLFFTMVVFIIISIVYDYYFDPFDSHKKEKYKRLY